MDGRMKEKLRTGNLTNQDVRSIIDWQLTLSEEKIDSRLIYECLLFLYPDEPGLPEDAIERFWQTVKQAVFGRRRRAPGHHGRSSARALMIALLITLLIAGAAIAAKLGIFERFIQHPLSEMSSARLEHLAKEGQSLNQVIEVEIPQPENPAQARRHEALTDMEAIIARQDSRRIELMMDQVYCDGSNLYYSYQLSEPERMLVLGEGKPTGFDQWEDTYPGQTIRDMHWTIGEGDAEAQEIAQWLCAGGPRYVIYDHVGMGDGASLNDGTEKGLYMAIYDSNSEYIDAFTQQGFQQVELPAGYIPGESIDVLMPVSIWTRVVYQDETGLYMSVVRNPENRGYHHVPVTAAITGRPEHLSAQAIFDEYAAEAQLSISDVDIDGDVYIDAPRTWLDDFESSDMDEEPYVMDYVLIADGTQYTNVDGGFGIDRETGKWHVMIRYDLPETADSLVLVPRRHGVGLVDAEKIVIR